MPSKRPPHPTIPMPSVEPVDPGPPVAVLIAGDSRTVWLGPGRTPCPICARKSHRHAYGDTAVRSTQGGNHYMICRRCNHTWTAVDAAEAAIAEAARSAEELRCANADLATARAHETIRRADLERARAAHLDAQKRLRAAEEKLKSITGVIA